MGHLRQSRHQSPLGKLKWAGRASVKGTLSDRSEDQPRDDARADAGKWEIELPTGMLERDEAEGIWPQNLPAVIAYLSVNSQWRIVAQADGTLFSVGLDYPAVRIGLEMARIEVTPELWSDLRMIEIGARAAMNGET